MEEKTIIITEKAENAILGQESVFGWEMKEKNPAGKFLFYKYNQYVLTRERDPEEVTQAHLDVEKRWDDEFSVWNEYILNDFKKCLVLELFSWIILIIGLVFTEIGVTSYDTTTSIVGVVILLVSILLSLPTMIMTSKNGTQKLKKMDGISRDMRLVNSLRNKKDKE